MEQCFNFTHCLLFLLYFFLLSLATKLGVSTFFLCLFYYPSFCPLWSSNSSVSTPAKINSGPGWKNKKRNSRTPPLNSSQGSMSSARLCKIKALIQSNASSSHCVMSPVDSPGVVSAKIRLSIISNYRQAFGPHSVFALCLAQHRTAPRHSTFCRGWASTGRIVKVEAELPLPQSSSWFITLLGSCDATW